jgi:GNAT superfamily N-acetyltransferase
LALFAPVAATIVGSMSEPLIDIAAVPDRPEISRWQAVAPRGSVAGVASLRPLLAFEHDVLPPADPATTPGAAVLSLYVELPWRRRGIGSRLLDTVRTAAVAPRLVADVLAGSPGEAFCLGHGFRHLRSRRHDVLTYCDVHRAWLGELVEAEHRGYRLTHWTGDLPRNSRVEELLRGPSRPGNTVLTAADADGDLGAYALAIVGAVARPRAHQYGPTVLPGHRGRRLGPWVNAALIQRLRELHPHVNEIETATAEDDTTRLAALGHLGFQPLRRTRLYELARQEPAPHPRRGLS